MIIRIRNKGALTFIFAATLFLLSLFPAQAAENEPPPSIPDLSGTPWATWKVPPGTQLIKSERTGQFTLKFPGGVTIGDGPFGSNDASGKGAILCVRSIYAGMKKLLDECGMSPSVPFDPQQAYFWTSLAASAGEKDNYELQSILRTAKEKLTPQQLETLDAQVKAWKPTSPPARAAEMQELKKQTPSFSLHSDEKIKFAQALAGEGDAESQYWLGSIFDDNRERMPVKQDLAEAAKWYRKSADQGYPRAQLALGRLYAEAGRFPGTGGGQMSDDVLKPLLSDALIRIDDFIVTNSPMPITKEQINQQMQSAKLPEGTCNSGDARNMLNAIRGTTPEKFKAGIDDLLSVPRPPVWNPCL